MKKILNLSLVVWKKIIKKYHCLRKLLKIYLLTIFLKFGEHFLKTIFILVIMIIVVCFKKVFCFYFFMANITFSYWFPVNNQVFLYSYSSSLIIFYLTIFNTKHNSYDQFLQNMPLNVDSVFCYSHLIELISK